MLLLSVALLKMLLKSKYAILIDEIHISAKKTGAILWLWSFCIIGMCSINKYRWQKRTYIIMIETFFACKISQGGIN